jgi:hypothetical protein
MSYELSGAYSYDIVLGLTYLKYFTDYKFYYTIFNNTTILIISKTEVELPNFYSTYFPAELYYGSPRIRIFGKLFDRPYDAISKLTSDLNIFNNKSIYKQLCIDFGFPYITDHNQYPMDIRLEIEYIDSRLVTWNKSTGQIGKPIVATKSSIMGFLSGMLLLKLANLHSSGLMNLHSVRIRISSRVWKLAKYVYTNCREELINKYIRIDK